jgi:hypothetical protein
MRLSDYLSYVWRVTALCVLLLGGNNLLYAEEPGDLHPYLTNKFFVDVGMFFPYWETRIRVDGSFGGVNDYIDFDRAGNFDEDDETFSFDMGWRFGKKWSLLTQYFKSSDGHGAVLTEDVEWEDVIFESGTNIVAGQEFAIARLFFGRELGTKGPHEFGAGLGFHHIKYTAFIQGEVLIAGMPGGFRREAVTSEQPLPNIGAWYKYSLSPKWAFRSRLDWIDASVDKYDGSLINASLGVNYQFARNFGLGVNVNVIELDVTVNEPDWRGRLVTRYEGMYVYISAYW